MDIPVALKTFGDAVRISEICERYNDYFDIDMIHGRYVIDASSILGVESLVGNNVVIHVASRPGIEDKLIQLRDEIINVLR